MIKRVIRFQFSLRLFGMTGWTFSVCFVPFSEPRSKSTLYCSGTLIIDDTGFDSFLASSSALSAHCTVCGTNATTAAESTAVTICLATLSMRFAPEVWKVILVSAESKLRSAPSWFARAGAQAPWYCRQRASRSPATCAAPRHFGGFKDGVRRIRKPPAVPLMRGRKLLQELGHGLVQALLLLLRRAARAHRLACGSAPQELLRYRIIDIQHQGADVHRGRRYGCHPSSESPSRGPERIEFLFLLNRDLVTHVQVNRVGILLGQRLGRELLVHGLLDLLVEDLVHRRGALDRDPTVGPELREIGPRHIVGTDGLANRRGRGEDE